MSETGMYAGSGTQAANAGATKELKVMEPNREPIATAGAASAGNRYAVRVKKGQEAVVMRVDTEQLGRQKKIAEANASIRRRSRS